MGSRIPGVGATYAGMAVALDVDVTITMERRSPVLTAALTRSPSSSPGPRCRSALITRSHHLTVLLHDCSHLTVLLEEYGPLKMTGTCRDMLGREHKIDQTIDFVAWWSAIGTRNELHSPAPAGEVGQQLDRLGKKLEQIEKHLRLKPGR